MTTDREKIAAIAREMGLTFRKGFPHVMNEAFIMDESCNENETRHFDPLTDGRDTLAVIEHFRPNIAYSNNSPHYTEESFGGLNWSAVILRGALFAYTSADLSRAVVECAYLCCVKESAVPAPKGDET